MSKELKVTLIKSPIGYDFTQRATVKALGLKKMNSSVIKEDTKEIRGMIKKINHLLSIEEIDKEQ
ncbi:MAG: large subunit ribosomal protein [Kosmotogales bacterium]|nr:large subunit ribosomal protein [Kosmotogales bacterium]